MGNCFSKNPKKKDFLQNTNTSLISYIELEFWMNDTSSIVLKESIKDKTQFERVIDNLTSIFLILNWDESKILCVGKFTKRYKNFALLPDTIQLNSIEWNYVKQILLNINEF